MKPISELTDRELLEGLCKIQTNQEKLLTSIKNMTIFIVIVLAFYFAGTLYILYQLGKSYNKIKAAENTLFNSNPLKDYNNSSYLDSLKMDTLK